MQPLLLFQHMKVAFVHDYLIQYGGAERVLEALMGLFPEAPIYTLLYDEERTHGRFKGRVAGTSFLNTEVVRRQHRPFIPLMPLAARFLTLPDAYDLVISDSAGFAKGVRHGRRAFHISYCHTPLRYAWETDSYFRSRAFRSVFGPAFAYLRSWDLRSAQRPHRLIANSAFIARKIKEYYGREADVVYPPVDTGVFYHDPPTQSHPPYFLAVGRLLPYKRFDLVIAAFKQLKLPLKIVGSGPEEAALRREAADAPGIEFMSFVGEETLRRLYSGARALVFPHVEDFGLVAAEAQACGTPVVAFRGGGVLEIAREGETGLFFDAQTPEAIAAVVRRVLETQFDRARVCRAAARFDRARFMREFLAQLPEGLR